MEMEIVQSKRKQPAERNRPPIDLLRRVVAYDPETGLFSWLARTVDLCADETAMRRWNTKYAGKPAFTHLDGTGRLDAGFLGYRTSAHRAAWAYVYGVWPEMLDHIDRDPLNNRIANLRETTDFRNAQNRALPTGIRQMRGGKWKATIMAGWTRPRVLGFFDTEAEAAAAREIAVARYYDEAGNLKPMPTKKWHRRHFVPA
jgi:hypothetical protein